MVHSAHLPSIEPRTTASFGALKQINAGALNVGYGEAGPAGGQAVVLLHGWPYYAKIRTPRFPKIAPRRFEPNVRQILPRGVNLVP